MLVKSNREGAIVVPYKDENDLGYGQKFVNLVPGWNEIPIIIWREARKVVMDKIKSGLLVEWSKNKPNEDGKWEVEDISFRRLSPDKACSIVEECFNLGSLNTWLKGGDGVEQETRDEVRLAIKERVSYLKNTTGE
jgi:hypothetical protein